MARRAKSDATVSGGVSGRVSGRTSRDGAAWSLRGGFSLIEVLVASAILSGVVLLGASLLVRSTFDTLVGRRHTEVSRLAGSSQEELLSLPLDRQRLVLPEGLDALVLEAHRTRTGEWGEEPATGDAVWRRQTRVRQFSVADLYDQAPSEPAVLEDPLRGGVDPATAHLRLIEVVVGSEGGPSMTGAAPRLSLVVVRAY